MPVAPTEIDHGPFLRQEGRQPAGQVGAFRAVTSSTQTILGRQRDASMFRGYDVTKGLGKVRDNGGLVGWIMQKIRARR